MYEIFMTHNRPWTKREIVFFTVLFILVTFILARLVRKKSIFLSQAVAGDALFVFVMIVLASTVFTRTPNGMHNYELIPFWSWAEAASGNLEYLKEIGLNMILFLPAGLLLPFVFHKKILIRYAVLLGASGSAIIECSQLIFCRGLFEWDDMIGNSIGTMIGCIISNQIVQKIQKIWENK